ncbi:hypothetical protein CLOSTMETH_00262 [[Clostridium] methylpentosum DSM 5476]|uniref:Uncharacterized protein n=1 Tax=[Clostridium] methylpentosum DSM 5476 TaxID=537013 RepID=C0E8W7_9FIRM|nr:hypothetical protein CLOSTMETH_00262 [[Clostridium] methylpentosum DSM 5476]
MFSLENYLYHPVLRFPSLPFICRFIAFLDAMIGYSTLNLTHFS